MIATCLLVFVAQARRYGRWLVDDALISFAYARTLSEGGGFAQQPGARPVEGISNPTWTLILAGLHHLGLLLHGHVWFGVEDYVVVPKALGGLFFVGTLLSAYVGYRSFLSPLRASLGMLVAGLFLATSPGYVIWAVGGLENALYGFLVALLASVVCRTIVTGDLLRVRTALLSSVLALLVALTRPDGAIYAAFYPLVVAALLSRARWRDSVRAVLVAVLTFSAPAIGLLLLRHAVFGLWVPNTAVAKSQGRYDIDWADRLRDLVDAASPVPAFVGAGVVTAALGLSWWRSRRAPGQRSETAGPGLWPAGLGLVVGLALSVLAYCVLNEDWMGAWRFATPVLVLAAILMGASMLALADLTRRWGARLLLGAATAALIVVGVVAHVPTVKAFADEPTVPGCYVAERHGRAFNLYADRLGVRTGTLLTPDLGGVLLTSRLTVIDLAGLTDPEIGRLRGNRDSRGVADYVFGQVHPTFIHAHGPWSKDLVSDPRMREQYVPLVKSMDWVRKSAVPPGFDLALLQAQSLQRALEVGEELPVRPRVSCGRLEVGQLPQT